MNLALRKRLIQASTGGTLAVAAVLTACYSHTGSDVVSGKRYTEAECRLLLNSDLRVALSVVERSVTASLTETQKAALASFVYNVGSGAFERSTLLKKLNARDKPGACNEMRRWVYVDGRVWKGLVSRRDVERKLCLKGTP